MGELVPTAERLLEAAVQSMPTDAEETNALRQALLRVQAEAAAQALADAVERVADAIHGSDCTCPYQATPEDIAKAREALGIAAAPASPEVEG